MSNSDNNSEQSMEEILASIRKIVAEEPTSDLPARDETKSASQSEAVATPPGTNFSDLLDDPEELNKADKSATSESTVFGANASQPLLVSWPFDDAPPTSNVVSGDNAAQPSLEDAGLSQRDALDTTAETGQIEAEVTPDNSEHLLPATAADQNKLEELARQEKVAERLQFFEPSADLRFQSQQDGEANKAEKSLFDNVELAQSDAAEQPRPGLSAAPEAVLQSFPGHEISSLDANKTAQQHTDEASHAVVDDNVDKPAPGTQSLEDLAASEDKSPLSAKLTERVEAGELLPHEVSVYAAFTPDAARLEQLSPSQPDAPASEHSDQEPAEQSNSIEQQDAIDQEQAEQTSRDPVQNIQTALGKTPLTFHNISSGPDEEVEDPSTNTDLNTDTLQSANENQVSAAISPSPPITADEILSKAPAANTQQPPQPIEAALSDLLRPMVQNWLEDNMPKLMEAAIDKKKSESDSDT